MMPHSPCRMSLRGAVMASNTMKQQGFGEVFNEIGRFCHLGQCHERPNDWHEHPVQIFLSGYFSIAGVFDILRSHDGKTEDRLNLVRLHQSADRPWSLPGTAIKLAGNNFRKPFDENVIPILDCECGDTSYAQPHSQQTPTVETFRSGNRY